MATEGKQDVAITSSKGQEVQKAMPVRTYLSPFDEMERMFESFFPRSRWMRPSRWDWPSFGELAMPLEGRMPRVDIIEKDDEIVVRAEVPGVDKKDLDISMTDNTITIKGRTNHEEKTESANYYCSEITHGEFSRTVALPADVDVDKAKAMFKDGVLEVDLPKIEKSKRRTLKLD